MKKYLLEIWKFKYLLILTTCLALIISYFGYQKANQNNIENTVFYSIATQNKSTGSDSSYENLQAADQFTESMQGWFRDPNFLNSINQNSGNNFGLNARKQEKNNLLITFKSHSQDSGEKHSQAIHQNLLGQIEKYNQNSDITFNLAIINHHSSETSANLLHYIFIALIAGLAFPIILISLKYSYYHLAN